MFLAAGAVSIALLTAFRPLVFELSEGELTRLAPGLLFLILLVERAVEFIVTDPNATRKRVLAAKKRRQETLLASAVARADGDASTLLQHDQEVIDRELAGYTAQRTAETRRIAFLAGLIVAACGFRILQVLVRDWPVDNAWQDTALQGLDLLLSALLLGGGSDFFHRFIKAIGRMGRPAA